MIKTKNELIQKAKINIANNNEAALKALLMIYDYQTFTEQEDGETKIYNKVGFTGRDARFATSYY